MFHLNPADLTHVVMEAQAVGMSLMADMSSTTDSAYIKIRNNNQDNYGYAFGTSNVIDHSLFIIGEYVSTNGDTLPNLIINQGHLGILNSNPQYALDTVGDMNITETYKIRGVTVIDSSLNIIVENINASSTIHAGSNITAGVDISAGSTIHAGSNISANANINAGTSINAGTDLSAASNITAGVDINAHRDIYAD